MQEYITRTQFSRIEKYFKVKTGRPRTYQIFDILNAIFHILITGSQWRNLPKDYPPYKSVFYHFNRWKKQKVIHQILANILKQKPRDLLVIDNQSISDSDLPNNKNKGYDGHKKRKGRKRCILTDRYGFIHCTKYYPANMHDTDCARNINRYRSMVIRDFGHQG